MLESGTNDQAVNLLVNSKKKFIFFYSIQYMSHLYIQYFNPDIVIYDAGQYDNVYIKIGEMKDGIPYLNRSKYWDLDYYEQEGFDDEEINRIKDDMIDLVARTFCCENYRIIKDNEYDRYNELKRKLEG